MDCTCSRCGKIFDYEKYYGICPKCAAYNKRGGTQDNYNIDKAFTARYDIKDDSCKNLHEQYDNASAHEPHKQHAEYHKTYDTAQMPQSHYGQQQTYQSGPAYGAAPVGNKPVTQKKRNGTKWIVFFFAFMFILLIGMIIYIANKDGIDRKLGIGVMDGPPERVDVMAGEAFGNEDVQISVDEVVVLGNHDSISVVPMGEILVTVHVDIDSDGGKNARKFEAPMLYCDGVYRECMGDYDVQYLLLPELTKGIEVDIDSYLSDSSVGGNYFYDIDANNYLSEYLYVNASDSGYFYYIVPSTAEEFYVVVEETKNSESDEVVRQYWIQPSVRDVSMRNRLLPEAGGAE